MNRISSSQESAVKLLSTYKYLTSSQFVTLGLYKRRGYVTNALKRLTDEKKPLILKCDFAPSYGKVEGFYYLSDHGVRFLIEELCYKTSTIKAPIGRLHTPFKDYHHRKYTIDFHIGFRIWLKAYGGRVEFVNYYFDKAGNNRDGLERVHAVNKITLDDNSSFIPDINIRFKIDGAEFLYLFEQHNGSDTKRLHEQLAVHLKALQQKVVSKKFGLEKSHRVVVVCEYESVKKSILERLSLDKNFERYVNYFIFKTNEELKEHFFENWTLFNGNRVNFIPKSKPKLQNAS